jgi:hypothetical protein
MGGSKVIPEDSASDGDHLFVEEECVDMLEVFSLNSKVYAYAAVGE